MIYLLPVLTALFGWFSISLLFYFLFRPVDKINLFILEVQGFIPKNLTAWGRQMGEWASREISVQKIKDSFLQDDQLQRIHDLLEAKSEDFLRNKLKEKIPVLAMFITDGLISKMKEALMTELDQLVPSVINQVASGLEKKFDVSKMVEEKIAAINSADPERLFYQSAGKGIRQLKIFMAAMGFLLGLFEWWLLTLL